MNTENSKKMVSPGELSVGMWVTVLENKPFKQEKFEDDFLSSLNNESGGIKTILNEDRSGFGDCLEILAIQLPYIVVCETRSKYSMDREFRYKIDTRRTILMELSREYVDAMHPKI